MEPFEAEFAVGVQRRGVVALDVEQDTGQTPIAEIVQAREGEQATEPLPCADESIPTT